MNLLYANPLTQAFHYLLLLFTGVPLDELYSNFSAADQKAYGNSLGSAELPAKLNRGGHDEFDFIIVGGGSAGSVLANRLSEDGNSSVLLIEAGGNPFPLTSVPPLAFTMLGNPNNNWQGQMVPQKEACQAHINSAPPVRRGKTLGGTSITNVMIYQRGNPNDFNNWAQETGDSSWEYENLLPYFKKLENYNGHFPQGKFHGTDGPLYVGSNGEGSLLNPWLEAGDELGYKTKDPNAYQTACFFPFDATVKEGTRCSAHRAYIYPALSRPNLNIRIYSHVTKIQFDEKHRAIGVQYTYKDKSYFVGAKKEVILSAGAVASPQILMLSGIGPEEHLKELGIPVRENLPVGNNLQDHLIVYVGPFLIDDGKIKTSADISKQFNLESLHQYILNDTGPFSLALLTGGAVIPSSFTNSSWPDMYFVVERMLINEMAAAANEQFVGFKPGVLEKYYKSDVGREGFLIPVVLGLPESRGEVRLKNTDPFESPLVDPMYFSHPQDMVVMMEGVKFALEIVNTKAFKKLGSKLTASPFPGCEEFGDVRSDDYWKCFLKQSTWSMFHLSGTCRMGKYEQDPKAVVDSNLRVIGTSGLRVVDGSIMTKITNTNPNIPIIMIAEKAADVIKTFWSSEKGQ